MVAETMPKSIFTSKIQKLNEPLHPIAVATAEACGFWVTWLRMLLIWMLELYFDLHH